MIFSSHSSSVPLSRSLESGTVEQGHDLRNTQWNTNGTLSLKALANKVLERNETWNKPGTETSKSVPPLSQSSIPCGTDSGTDDTTEYGDLSYEFEERTAIAEYDGNQTPIEAHRIAYLDAFISILSDLAEESLHQDWLVHKIQIALETLEAQHFSTQH